MKRNRILRGPMLVESGVAKSDSFSAMRDLVDRQLCIQIRKGMDMDLDGDGDADMNDYAWIMDMYPTQVVYSMNGRMFMCDYSIDKDDNVTLGTPVAVEQSYTPIGESQRAVERFAEAFGESDYNAASGELTLTVIKPGFNKSKQRFYPASMLKESHTIFDGAKMFADHQTDKESKERPEGSVRNWVANLGNTWVESDGRVRAKATVIDPPFKAKLDMLKEKGLLPEMGVSIRALGESSLAEIEGTKTQLVESLLKVRSVDFVTFAGAGGQVDAIAESNNPDVVELDLATLEQLRESRPDLVELIESNQELTMAKSIEQQLNESLAENLKLKTDHDALVKKFEESEKKSKQSATALVLETLLKESKLPDLSQKRLREQFKEAVEDKGIKEAITAEIEYVKAITGGKPAAAKVTAMGERENGREDIQESTPEEEAALIKRIEEAYIELGNTPEEAKIMARGK